MIEYQRDKIMARGKVKWFDREKNFGFIEDETGGKEYFVHISNVENEQSPEQGQLVEFEVGEGKKGPQAVEVRLIEM